MQSLRFHSIAEEREWRRSHKIAGRGLKCWKDESLLWNDGWRGEKVFIISCILFFNTTLCVIWALLYSYLAIMNQVVDEPGSTVSFPPSSFFYLIYQPPGSSRKPFKYITPLSCKFFAKLCRKSCTDQGADDSGSFIW